MNSGGIGKAGEACGSCGRQIDESNNYCPECDADLREGEGGHKSLPMVSGSWYHGVWISMISLLLFTPLIYVVPETGLTSLVAVVGLLGASVLMPVSIYLDNKFVHAFSDRSPNVTLYFVGSLVPLVNILVGAFYLSMRVNIPDISERANPALQAIKSPTAPEIRGKSSNERWPGKWYRGVAVGVIIWLGFFILASIVPSGSAPGVLGVIVEVYVVVTILNFFLFPAAIYLDCRHIESVSEWDRHTKTYLVGSVIPLFNIVLGAIYLVRRREVLGTP